jgi:hypothetical protein
MKVATLMRPADFDEESAVSIVHQLCMYPQKKLSLQLRKLPPHVCAQLLYLLRSRRVRVTGSDTGSVSFTPNKVAVNLLPMVKPPLSRLRTILPAPTADGSHLTLMESLLKEAYEEQRVPSSPVKKQLVMPVMPLKPFRFIRAKETCLQYQETDVIEIDKPLPPRKLSR